MTQQTIRPHDLAFSNTARAVQTRKGSREIYAASEEKGNWTGVMNTAVKKFIANPLSAGAPRRAADRARLS
ncbi:MAG: hypothetical protein EP348_03475 [Alphaproteobacteria bacterium]|nr:MAG: hypothetical protein EP348_03475 [Alphaproteobacteria bacterium]